MSVKLSKAEMAALEGMPWICRVLYVFGIRPYMDYATGIVGERRGISWQSLAEALYVEPGPGVVDSGLPSEKVVRRAAERIERGGLLVTNKVQNGRRKKLVFFCPLADMDSSVRNKVGSKWAVFQGGDVGSVENAETANENNVLPGDDGAYVDSDVVGGTPREVGTPPVSGNNCTVPTRDAREAIPDTVVMDGPGKWVEFFTAHPSVWLWHVAQTAKSMTMFRTWCQHRVSVGMVRDAMAAAEAQLGRVPDSPMYLRNFVEQVVVARQRSAEQPRGRTDAPRKRVSAAESMRRQGIEYLRKTGQFSDEEWQRYTSEIGRPDLPDPLGSSYDDVVDTHGRDVPSSVVEQDG